eukprot:9502464-Pyramimonas_sp.AAC.1
MQLVGTQPLCPVLARGLRRNRPARRVCVSVTASSQGRDGDDQLSSTSADGAIKTKVNNTLSSLDAVLGIPAEPEKTDYVVREETPVKVDYVVDVVEEPNKPEPSPTFDRSSQVLRALIEEDKNSSTRSGDASGRPSDSGSMWDKWEVPWGGFVLLTGFATTDSQRSPAVPVDYAGTSRRRVFLHIGRHARSTSRAGVQRRNNRPAGPPGSQSTAAPQQVDNRCPQSNWPPSH